MIFFIFPSSWARAGSSSHLYLYVILVKLVVKSVMYLFPHWCRIYPEVLKFWPNVESILCRIFLAFMQMTQLLAKFHFFCLLDNGVLT